MGPLVTRAGGRRQMQAAIDAGQWPKAATVLCGGERRPDLGPQFVEPDDRPDAGADRRSSSRKPSRRSSTCSSTTSFDEAIALHNGVPQGLSSAIFTESMRARRGVPVGARIRLRHRQRQHRHVAARRSAARSAARRKPAAAASPAPTPGRPTCAARPTRSTGRRSCRWRRASRSDRPTKPPPHSFI